MERSSNIDRCPTNPLIISEKPQDVKQGDKRGWVSSPKIDSPGRCFEKWILSWVFLEKTMSLHEDDISPAISFAENMLRLVCQRNSSNFFPLYCSFPCEERIKVKFSLIFCITQRVSIFFTLLMNVCFRAWPKIQWRGNVECLFKKIFCPISPHVCPDLYSFSFFPFLARNFFFLP